MLNQCSMSGAFDARNNLRADWLRCFRSKNHSSRLLQSEALTITKLQLVINYQNILWNIYHIL